MLGACNRGQKDEMEFRIGLIVPMKEEMEGFATSIVEGARFAVKEKNLEGGIKVDGKEYRVVLVEKDSQNKPESAVSAAHELINQEHVSAIIGPATSRNAIPVAGVVDKAQIPMITPTATNPEVTRGTQYVFRVCYTDDFQGKVMAKFVKEELNLQRAAVLYDIATPYNRGISEIFKKNFKELGGEIVAFEGYITGDQNFRAQLLRIKASEPEILFIPNYPQDIIIQIDQIYELGIETQIIGSDSMGFRKESRAKLEGVFFSEHFSTEIPSDKVKIFLKDYESEYNAAPIGSGALAYDAFGVLFQAVKDQDSIDPKKIRTGLNAIRNYEGVTGTIDYNGSPDPVKSVVIINVRDGKYFYHTQISP
jgi:branched-chain amino acid transport system substrate-binding protein